MHKKPISFILNGERVEVVIDPSITLLNLLREHLHITSPKKACERGNCGGCTVILDDKTVNSCLILAVTVDGREVQTVESLGTPDNLHPLQQAFVEMGGSQCGYCTPGFIISAKALLDKNPDPSYEEVKEGLSGNLCRCTGYVKPIEAVLKAAKEIRDKG